jgi:hypothetical protein
MNWARRNTVKLIGIVTILMLMLPSGTTPVAAQNGGQASPEPSIVPTALPTDTPVQPSLTDTVEAPTPTETVTATAQPLQPQGQSATNAQAETPGAAAPLIVHPYHNFKVVCPLAVGKNSARCYSQVVTDDTGQQITSATLLTGSYGPSAFRGAYGVSGTSATNRTVAIVDANDNPTILNDLDTYSDNFGIPRLSRCAVSTGTAANPCIQKVDQNGGTSYPAYDSGWALEIALDVEAVHAVCQSCNILLVEAASSYTSDLISGADQRAYLMGANVVSNSWGNSEYNGETTIDSYFNHPGVAYVFSTGDSGYGAQSPASSPNVTAVGGTTLLVNSDYSYNSETAWNGAGSGCSAYEAKPNFQHDTGCPTHRTVADVSADADPNTGAAVYTNSSWYQVGGTSLSSPLVAAIIALGGGVGTTLGNSLPYANLNYGVNLRDVTSGNNGSCSGSYLCTAMAGYDGPTGLGSPRGTTAFIPASTNTQTLTVSKSGTGTGTVTSNPAGINCGSTCSYAFNLNAVVTLTAAATSPSTFVGWSGDCSGAGTCTVTMSAAHSVTAAFTAPNQTLTVSKAGAGTGTVTSNPTGINCGSTCSYAFTYNTPVTLTATAASGSAFGGWSGAGCSGTGTCSVTMSAAQSVTATFNLTGNQTLTVSKRGDGTGTVTSSPTGISCGSTCTHAYALNTAVTLTAKAASGSTFTGWGGVCSGTGTCAVTMNAPKSVTAGFALNNNTLTVTKTGTGAGTVTSSPTGINCGSTCSYSFAKNTVVTLTAAATAPSLFGGWNGAGCSGTGTCQVTMSAAQSVSAAFNPGVSITVNGALQGDYTIPATSTQSYAYPGLQNGPVEVLSSTGQPIIPSERSFYGPYSSFNEILGFPNSRLTTDYWFPWYDNVNMITWVLVGNPSKTATASVTIKIAGSVVGTYSIGPSGNVTPTFDGVQNGPVEVTSTIPVFTSERNLYGYPSGSQSFNETLGYPNNQLTTDYWFTWYDDKDMQTQIWVANPSSTATASATIKIAGAVMGTYSIGPHTTVTESYAGVQDGPVEVTGTRSIVASERSYWGPSTSYTFNEVMGYPNNQLSTDYWFSWYDNVNMITWVLVGNPSTTATANVTIKIAGAVVGTYSIGPSGNVTPTFDNVKNGPVEVTSNINVFTSERVLQSYPGADASFNEYLGIPNSQLSTDYWFTWYDDKDMVTNIMVGRP